MENVLSGKSFIWAHRKVTTNESGYKAFHAHPGLEFLYVEQGAGHVLIDKRTIPITAKTLYLFQPYQLHRVHAEADETRPYIRHVLVVDPYVFEPYFASFPHLGGYFGMLWKGVLTSQCFEAQEMTSLYDRLQDDIGEGTHVRDIENVAATLLDFVRVVRRANSEGKDAEYRQPLLRSTGLAEQAMSWLEEHYHESFHLQELASRLHVSPFYLSRMFKQDTGNTIQEYILARRLREACLLLQNTEYSMTTLAERVGFGTSSYFVHSFRKHVGITPLQYRKQWRTM